MAAVAWLLLTTVPVSSPADAWERLAWYACRWGIAVWHKILKRGCRIERRQLPTAARLQRGLTIYSVIAWRILWATLLARVEPDLPCTVLLEAAAWQARYGHIQQNHPAAHATLRAPSGPLARQSRRLAGRPGEGDPGPTVRWRGFQHLAARTAMYRLFRPARAALPPHAPEQMGAKGVTIQVPGRAAVAGRGR